MNCFEFHNCARNTCKRNLALFPLWNVPNNFFCSIYMSQQHSHPRPPVSATPLIITFIHVQKPPQDLCERFRVFEAVWAIFDGYVSNSHGNIFN